MNLTAPLSFIAALALVGCSAPVVVSQEETDWQQATQTHTIGGYEAFLGTYSESEHRGAAESAIGVMREHAAWAETIRANWSELREGLTLDQVNKLLGPIDEVSLQHLVDGMDLAREYGLTDSTNTLMNQSPAGLYKLVFNTDGKLTEWSWE